MNASRPEPSRNDVAQKAPASGLSVAGFPDGEQPETSMFRAHNPKFGPWFFASHRDARFNLEAPNGTCYFAADVETAVREVLGPQILRSNRISAVRASQLAVSVVNPPDGATYAHVSGRGAARYGVTSELTTMGDYAVSQAWAELLNTSGFDGIRYNSRFDPGAESWALFGPAGPNLSLGVDPSGTIDGEDALRAAGIRIMPSSVRKSSVRIVGNPSA